MQTKSGNMIKKDVTPSKQISVLNKNKDLAVNCLKVLLECHQSLILVEVGNRFRKSTQMRHRLIHLKQWLRRHKFHSKSLLTLTWVSRLYIRAIQRITQKQKMLRLLDSNKNKNDTQVYLTDKRKTWLVMINSWREFMNWKIRIRCSWR